MRQLPIQLDLSEQRNPSFVTRQPPPPKNLELQKDLVQVLKDKFEDNPTPANFYDFVNEDKKLEALKQM